MTTPPQFCSFHGNILLWWHLQDYYYHYSYFFWLLLWLFVINIILTVGSHILILNRPGLWGMSSQTVEKWKILECKAQEITCSAIVLHQVYFFLSFPLPFPCQAIVILPEYMWISLSQHKDVHSCYCCWFVFRERMCVSLCTCAHAHTGEGGRIYTLKAF